MPADGRATPGIAARSFDAIAVQVTRNGAPRFAPSELCKDAADKRSFGFHNFSVTSNGRSINGSMVEDTIAIRSTSARLAHPPLYSSVHPYGEVLEKESVYRAFQADAQLVDLALSTSEDLEPSVARLRAESTSIIGGMVMSGTAILLVRSSIARAVVVG
jgi:hypothetical protein